MTTIFWVGNRVYSDSNIVHAEGEFASLSKIKRYATPFPFISEKLKVDDTIYGYVTTGNVVPADKLAKVIQDFRHVDTLAMMYRVVESVGMVVAENFFEVIFIGAKANYSFAPPIHKREVIEIKPHNSQWVIGSGTEPLKRIIDKYPNPNPIRLMYAIYAQDEHSSGMIDVWELKKRKGETSFERIGMCRGVEDRSIHRLIDDMYAPYELDWKANPRAEKRELRPAPKPRPVKRESQRPLILP